MTRPSASSVPPTPEPSDERRDDRPNGWKRAAAALASGGLTEVFRPDDPHPTEPRDNEITRWLRDEDGSIIRSIEGALIGVAMERGRGGKVSDQAEVVRVLHALRELAGAQ